MKVFQRCFWFVAILLLAPAVSAAETPRLARGGGQILSGAPVSQASAGRDTVVLIGPHGSGALHNGQFQDPGGAPNWQGWTSVDYTQRSYAIWHVDTYGAVRGAYSAWCGELSYGPCDESDPPGGYGNNYQEWLDWSRSVGNPAVATTLQVSGLMTRDTEYGYDYVYLECLKNGMLPEQLLVLDGAAEAELFDELATYGPADYLGPAGDEVRLRFKVVSDGAWSDADCLAPSDGACRLDSLTVRMVNDGVVATSFNDFEDGTMGSWEVAFPVGVGDFAKLWVGLRDLDPCDGNFSSQVAFIDDGLVVPGTGGSSCVNWCYGPGGYIVTTSGGLAGPSYHIHNAVLSPVIAWPDAGLDGCRFAHDVYLHEDLSADAPGIFNTWDIRSTAGSAADIEAATWKNRSFIYYGGPWYERQDHVLGDLLQPGRTFVQVQLAVYEIGYVWGWYGDDGYPAPYYDNVLLQAYTYEGPGLTAREIDLAQDAFPADGAFDLGSPATLSVRFDMAQSIAPDGDLRNDPGDSIVATIVPQRTGSELLADGIRLYYRLHANPSFDPFRSSGLPTVGWVAGHQAARGGLPVSDRYCFDLPDSGFFFPGDVLHYYLSASDWLAGDSRTAILPADTTGFSDFSGPLSYHSSFTVRALPTLQGYGPDFETPRILFWNDFGNRGGQDEWHTALRLAGALAGLDYDTYYTNGPSSGVGNGLGGRANSAQLAGYETLLYSSGDLSRSTIANGDFQNDCSDDVGVLDGWLQLGERNMFLTGDNLVTDLARSGSAALDFMEYWLSLRLVSMDLRPLINNQAAPKVRTVPGNPVIYAPEGWLVYGGCPGLNTFDAVEPVGTAIPLAQFLDPTGAASAYTYSPATLNLVPAFTARVISLPYDLMSVYNDPTLADKAPASLPARAQLLKSVFNYFGYEVMYPTDVPEAGRFAVRSYPNPFNPQTRIEYSLPADGRLTVTVFDARGARVRTVLDEVRPAGKDFLVWDGTDQSGARVASGLYFYEVRAGQETRIGKMMLVK